MDYDFFIHLNRKELEGQYFNEKCLLRISFLYPWGFYLEKTDIGEHILTLSRLYSSDIKYDFPNGICKWIENQVAERLDGKGYSLKKIRPEMMDGFDFEHDEVYMMCDDLLIRTKKSDLSKLYRCGGNGKTAEPTDILVAGILDASSKDEKTGEYRNFTNSFLKLGGKSIKDILLDSGRCMERVDKPKIPSDDVDYIEKNILKLSFALANNKQVSEVNMILKNLTKMSKLGNSYDDSELKELGGISSELFDYTSRNLNLAEGIKRVPDYNTKEMLFQNIMLNTEMYIRRIRGD